LNLRFAKSGLPEFNRLNKKKMSAKTKKAKATRVSAKGEKKSPDKKQNEHVRFGISLVVLMTFLVVSVFFLLISLIQIK
jgi:hypothetical protein